MCKTLIDIGYTYRVLLIVLIITKDFVFSLRKNEIRLLFAKDLYTKV